jgi:hypothetical protein
MAATFWDQMTGQVPFTETIGSTIPSGSTIAPTSPIHSVSGITAISTITVPYTGFTGMIILIPTGLWTTLLTGNIGLATTAIVGKAVILIYDGTKWWPSY